MSGGLERDGDVIDTKADVWHPSLFTECKQRKELPIWDDFKELRRKARRVDMDPMMVLHHPDEGTLLCVIDLDEAVAFAAAMNDRRGVSQSRVLLSHYVVEHRVERRNWCYSRWDDAQEKAEAEDKVPMLALGKVNCPGGLAVFRLP